MSISASLIHSMSPASYPWYGFCTEASVNKQSLLMIGGGAAGLMAAYQLSSLYNITLLEANDRLGGRMWTSTPPGFDAPIEAGAEFVHGKLPLTLGLLNKAGISYKAIKGHMYRKQNGRLEEQTGMTEGWDLLLEKMQQLETDMSLQDFLLQYFPGEHYEELRHQAINYAGGFDLADAAKASTKALYREWSKEEEDTNYRIDGGYARLVAYLQQECTARGCRILTGKTVKQVDWSANDVKVYTSDGEQYNAVQLIVSVPAIVLNQPGHNYSINFTPPLREQEQALQQLGIGKVIKVILRFKEMFWKKDAGFFFSEEAFPTWWTQLPDKIPLLTGWAGGPKAAELEQHSDETLLEIALQSLSHIFDIPVNELKNNLAASFVANWQAAIPGLHGYSYSTLASAAARKFLREPVDHTIWFCGEALYEGEDPGTVEAALVSGKEVAGRMLGGSDE